MLNLNNLNRNQKPLIMRKFCIPTLIIVFAGIILISSCQTYQLTPRNEEIKTFATDFRKYTEKGFLFMPDEYFGEYEVLGIINAELHPTVLYREGRETALEGSGYTSSQFWAGDKIYSKVIEVPDIDDLIEHIYDISVQWGGDAFTHFQTSILTDTTDDNPNTTYNYYAISGIVIKRK